MKHANGHVDNHGIVERDRKRPVVVPGDLNDIARKRKDSKSSPPSEEYVANYVGINWNGKKRRAVA